MRRETLEIFGDPISKHLEGLAQSVDYAISSAVSKVPEVEEARKQLAIVSERLKSLHEEKANETFLHPRNLGSHFYPGIFDGILRNTSDCKYCKCWMGGYRSGGPDGVDPAGECPGNPKLRTAYDLLKKEVVGGCEALGRSPFEGLSELPCDIAEALEQFKLSIIRHRAMKWEDIEQGVLLDVMKRLSVFAKMKS